MKRTDISRTIQNIQRTGKQVNLSGNIKTTPPSLKLAKKRKSPTKHSPSSAEKRAMKEEQKRAMESNSSKPSAYTRSPLDDEPYVSMVKKTYPQTGISPSSEMEDSDLNRSRREDRKIEKFE